jgi:hypothetical protein
MIHTIYAITLAFILCPIHVFASNASITFPGSINHVPSANHHYILHNVDYDNAIDKLENHHSLFITNLKNNATQRIYNYGRWVDVLWSPRDRYLSVNDYGGSDFTDCIVFSLGDDGYHKISIKEKLQQYPLAPKAVFGNGHSYITCQKWLGKGKILIRAYGYGTISPQGFELMYDYDVLKGAITIHKKRH